MKIGELKADGKPNKLGAKPRSCVEQSCFWPHHHRPMGERYDFRSDIEHLHDYKHLEARDRPTRVWLAEPEAFAEFVARSCLARIILNPALAGNFGGALADFWAKPEAVRHALWGAPISPRIPLDGFNFDHVSNRDLGARS